MEIKLHIKNMVSSRCISQVEQILNDMGIAYTIVNLGESIINQELSLLQELEFKNKLKKSGLEMIDDHKTILSEKIKLIIIETLNFLKIICHSVYLNSGFWLPNFGNYLKKSYVISVKS
jgi:hypothetical protein